MTDSKRVLDRAYAVLHTRLPELWAILAAFAWFRYLGYGPTLDPTFVDWMWRDDWAAYQWGFSFFRNADWGFPLGRIPNLFYPYGTSVGFTDANPWLCVLFKPLSPILPLDFQFSGIWFLLCYALQAWFGTKICRTFTPDPVQIALGGALFATTPVLPMRAPHVALCALFFLTAGVWLNLARVESEAAARRGMLITFLLLAWAAGTHAYLSVMLIALCIAYYTRLCFVDRLVAPRAFSLSVLLALGLSLGIYYLFGFLAWKKTELSVEGFGEFSADLLALANSQGSSRYVPAFPFQPRQWEGYAYLGLGTLLLMPLLLLRICLQPRSFLRALSSFWPLLLVVGAMSFYALSSHVTLRGELVLDLTPLYAPLGKYVGIFRSSGRFAWPLHLLLIAAGVRAAIFREQRYLSYALLALALFLRVAEQDPDRVHFDPLPLRALADPVWQSSERDYKHLALVPIHLQWNCQYDAPLVDALSHEAYRRKLSFNSGNFMRQEPGTHALCGQSVSPLDAHTVYVVEPAYVASLKQQNAACGVLDGLYVCVTNARATALRTALLRTPL
jgi:hypothetical protein